MDIRSLPQPSWNIEDSMYSRWNYATSDTRSEPLEQSPRSSASSLPQTPQPRSCPPPFDLPLSPVETSRGVWEDDDGVYYGSSWSPVQKYLGRIRKERRMLKAPSEIIFVLAALDVAHSPWDVAHWIFWPSATYFSTADRVTAIALHQPRLIKTQIPWIGSREHKWIINAFQEKYYYIHILGRWYPTTYQPVETKKRTLRSNGGGEERPDITINQFFNIVEGYNPPTKRARRAPKKVDETDTPPNDKRTRRLPQQKPALPTPLSEPSEQILQNAQLVADDSSAPIIRSSGRIKRKLSPSTRAPRILTAINPPSPSLSSLSESSSASSLHSRNRSTSQSSEVTIVDKAHDSRRSASVDSIETVVGASLSKKRKANALDDADDIASQEIESESPERMVTRGRFSKTLRHGESDMNVDDGFSPLSEPPSSPAELRPKSTRPRTKSRKARA
ncbi:hypothetical protein CPB83DRAFT_908227 [Crepidotus variabilis]|uniref:Uncharacterized protein n=1 Tax=Crepidotus variabilis TaxID=179855 RepID=A0A9P6ECM1_9AGAR|nr:hypothetical protein CPB83DRAFT_908227 [Crepidotus variabilis]